MGAVNTHNKKYKYVIGQREPKDYDVYGPLNSQSTPNGDLPPIDPTQRASAIKNSNIRGSSQKVELSKGGFKMSKDVPINDNSLDNSQLGSDQ